MLELLISKFNLYLVEETSLSNSSCSKLVVQFENQMAIEQFNAERALWESDAQEDAVLTYAKRRDLFSCIESVRGMTREDRIGPRLKSFADSFTEDSSFSLICKTLQIKSKDTFGRPITIEITGV